MDVKMLSSDQSEIDLRALEEDDEVDDTLNMEVQG